VRCRKVKVAVVAGFFAEGDVDVDA